MTANRAPSNSSQSLRVFFVVWLGQLVSSLGNGMTAFALAVRLYQETRTATAVAVVMLCLFTPAACSFC